ncbi:HD domain-containing protein [Shimazuella kribbensis]|uniref:HD domain-containing protein n=1 Tax=Shimazuella kribbensis TaxID=139808 RepID=UPI00040A4BC0|nr:HD domain-containing protein [Shimazuella kribbensis]
MIAHNHQGFMIIHNLITNRKMPARLLTHLTTVHEVAHSILAWMEKTYPQISIDREAILFGAITHDIGKIKAKEEINKLGSTHEQLGYELMLEYGITPELARFTYTHSQWMRADTKLEDWIVSLADKVWKGKRVAEIEERIINHIHEITNQQEWEIFLKLDDLLQKITKDAHQRLLTQASQSISTN